MAAMFMRHSGLASAFLPVILAAAACSSTAELQPVQRLDERTGVTLAALPAPLEFVQAGMTTPNQHASFAYLGPIQWDSMGQLSYALWLHVAPGNDRQIASLALTAQLSLALDDGLMTLSVASAPMLGRPPYQPVASWGQTAYFGLSLEQLGRIARSRKCVLQLLGADGVAVEFQPQQDTAKIFTGFLQSRDVTGG